MGSRQYAIAYAAFEARAAEVEEAIETLAISLKREPEARDQANSGHAGDLGHVAALLNQVLAFLNSKEG